MKRRRRARVVLPAPAGGWESVAGSGGVVTLCHPEWRGLRTSAYGHRAPVIELADPGSVAEPLAAQLAAAGVRTLVVQGFPPGTGQLLSAATRLGLRTRCVLQSSMAQHGGEPTEAAVADEVVSLLRAGQLGRFGVAKQGLAETLGALGVEAWFVPNRLPPMPPIDRVALPAGRRHVGVFAEPVFRKNVVTQLGAVALMAGAHAHVVHAPAVAYLSDLPMTAYGLLPWDRFMSLHASVDLNLYVTLSECWPLTPLESYALGVPCLSSRTSGVFRDDPELWALTTVTELDDATAIAAAAELLLSRREVAVERARAWIARWDAIATDRWAEFIGD